jgi:hypothetical protein
MIANRRNADEAFWHQRAAMKLIQSGSFLPARSEG